MSDPAEQLAHKVKRDMYALAADRGSVAVADGDPEGEMGWAAVHRHGQLIASYTEPADDGLL